MNWFDKNEFWIVATTFILPVIGLIILGLGAIWLNIENDIRENYVECVKTAVSEFELRRCALLKGL